MPNVPAMLEAHFAVPLLRTVLVAINTRLAAPEIAYILDHSGASVLVVDAELAPVVAAVLPARAALRHVVVVQDGDASNPLDAPQYEDLLAAATPLALAETRDDENRLLSINYTSGTTGSPKGAVYTHRGGYLNALAMIVQFRLDSWGEVPKAFVTLKAGATATAEELIQFSRDRLAHFKCPKAVVFTDLPKTSTGKIQKFVLREPEWKGHSKRVN